MVLFGLFVLAVAASVFRSAMRGRTEALIALLFFLVRGAAEAAPFAGLPLFPALVFYASVSLCLSRSDGRRRPDTRGCGRRIRSAGRRARGRAARCDELNGASRALRRRAMTEFVDLLTTCHVGKDGLDGPVPARRIGEAARR